MPLFRNALPPRYGRARRPWWLALLALAAGWVYTTYFAPDQETRKRTTKREPAAKKRTTKRPDTKRTDTRGIPTLHLTVYLITSSFS